MKLAIGCDEAAYRLKVIIMEHLKEKHAEIEVTDFGVAQGNTVLYPNVAYTVADAVASGGFQRGILLCGTGIGMCICANKVPGIRAAVCHDPYSAERSRKSPQGSGDQPTGTRTHPECRGTVRQYQMLRTR